MFMMQGPNDQQALMVNLVLQLKGEEEDSLM